MDVTELDRALGSTLAILASVQPGQLDAPTPCASWDVRALINHFIGTARWWAGVVDGDEAPPVALSRRDYRGRITPPGTTSRPIRKHARSRSRRSARRTCPAG